MSQQITQQEGLEEELHREKATRLAVEDAKLIVEEEKVALEDDKLQMEIELVALQEKYEEATIELNEVNRKFNPLQDNLDVYKRQYDEQSKKLQTLTKQFEKAETKISTYSVRNVNKRLKTRQKNIRAAEEKNEQLEKAKSRMTEAIEEVKNELDDALSKLRNTEREKKRLEERLASKVVFNTKVKKKAWKIKQKMMQKDSAELYTAEDVGKLNNRLQMMTQRVDELEELLALMNDDDIVSFKDRKYTDEIRETIMALLSFNVATSKVNEVILFPIYSAKEK